MNFDEALEEKYLLPRIRERRIKTREDLKVYEEIFDKQTVFALYKLIRKKQIDKIGGVINSGKEAVVLNAYSKKNGELAVKIYRTLTAGFRDRRIYIVGDERFKRFKKNVKSMVYLWTSKEYKNLKRMHQANIDAPKPITWVKNILVMEFIGENGVPAPLLKDTLIRNPAKIFKIIMGNIKKMFLKAKLVHADLSEYNIMMWRKPVIIDVSQAVLVTHPYAIDFLTQDIKRITTYFNKKGVETKNPQHYLQEILERSEEEQK